jgi:hypothetical protein
MPINNPEGVSFSNGRIRPAADKAAQFYYFAKAVYQEWTANDMGSILTVGGGEIEDGSTTDGRHVITGNDATNVIVRLGEFVADMEANGGAKLNTLLAVAVHPLGQGQ